MFVVPFIFYISLAFTISDHLQKKKKNTICKSHMYIMNCINIYREREREKERESENSNIECLYIYMCVCVCVCVCVWACLCGL